MGKWYNANIKNIWWVNSNDFFEKHVEEFVSFNELQEGLINPRFPIDNTSGMEFEIIENDKTGILPNYWKLVRDENNTLYFYKDEATAYLNMSNNTTTYRLKLDVWNTIFWRMFKTLQTANPKVKHIQALANPFTWDSTSINFNLFNQLEVGQTANFDLPLKKEYIFGTNPRNLCVLNSINYTEDLEKLDTDNIQPTNNWLLLVSKGSCLKYIKFPSDNSEPKVYNVGGDNLILTYINAKNIKPLTNGAVYAFQDKVSRKFINPLASSEVIKAFTTDIPPSLLTSILGLSVQQADLFWTDDKGEQQIYQLAYYQIPPTTLLTFKLREFDIKTTYNKNSLQGRLFDTINNKTRYETHNTNFLNHPKYFFESVNFNDNYNITYDLSNINFQRSISDISEHLVLNVSVSFAEGEIIYYNFGNDVNESNPLYNNTNSNVSTTNPRISPIFGSASADYFDNNVTAGWTAIANRNNANTLADMSWQEQRISLVSSMGSDIMGTAGNVAGGIAGKNPIAGGIIAGAGGLLKIASSLWTGITKYRNDQTRHDIEIANNNNALINTFNNFNTKPSNYISSPFILSSIPNVVHGENYLFNTYSYYIDSNQAANYLAQVLESGWNINKFGNFRDYENNTYMTVYHIDNIFNKSFMIELLNTNQKWMFNNLYYREEFINFLGAGFKVWKVRPTTSLLFENVKNNLPTWDMKNNINDIILVTNIDNIAFENEWYDKTPANITNLVKNRIVITNPSLNDFINVHPSFWEDLDITIDRTLKTIILTCHTTDYMYGTITLNYSVIGDDIYCLCYEYSDNSFEFIYVTINSKPYNVVEIPANVTMFYYNNISIGINWSSPSFTLNNNYTLDIHPWMNFQQSIIITANNDGLSSTINLNESMLSVEIHSVDNVLLSDNINNIETLSLYDIGNFAILKQDGIIEITCSFIHFENVVINLTKYQGLFLDFEHKVGNVYFKHVNMNVDDISNVRFSNMNGALNSGIIFRMEDQDKVWHSWFTFYNFDLNKSINPKPFYFVYNGNPEPSYKIDIAYVSMDDPKNWLASDPAYINTVRD